MGPEAKFYPQIKRNFKQLSLIRIENSSLLGTPDLLVCNTSGNFCTIELKVTKGNKLRFSPHQIAFHVKHPTNTYILATTLDQRTPILYPGVMVKELAACGLALEACRLPLAAWSELEDSLLLAA